MINIGIADDHAVVRSGLRELVTDCVDTRVVGEAVNRREAIELVCQTGLKHDVLVLESMMPGQSAQDALLQIKARAPDIAVLILSSHPQALYAATVSRQGASGYLDKGWMPESTSDELSLSVRTVRAHRMHLLQKLDLASNRDLTYYVVKNKLIAC